MLKSKWVFLTWFHFQLFIDSLLSIIKQYGSGFIPSCLLWCRTIMMKFWSDYKDDFVEKHAVKLGFMSAFETVSIKWVQASKTYLSWMKNLELLFFHLSCFSGLTYHDSFSGSCFVVVPVNRNAETMNFAEIEKENNVLFAYPSRWWLQCYAIHL